MDIGKRIRERREKLGLKQTDLANALMVSPQAVSKWERGETCPDISCLLDLSQILDVTTDYLLGATDLEQGIFDATVLATSLSQFAMKAMAMKSPEVADFANVIFHHLTEAVLKYDAVPVKYIGDGFLCFFSGTNHAQRAFDAALYAKKIIQNDNLKISLNSGAIYLGTIGHPDYANTDICGETVNYTFLQLDPIAQHCKTGVGLSGTTAHLLKYKDDIIEHKDIRLDLIDQTISVFEPKDINL